MIAADGRPVNVYNLAWCLHAHAYRMYNLNGMGFSAAGLTRTRIPYHFIYGTMVITLERMEGPENEERVFLAEQPNFRW